MLCWVQGHALSHGRKWKSVNTAAFLLAFKDDSSLAAKERVKWLLLLEH